MSLSKQHYPQGIATGAKSTSLTRTVRLSSHVCWSGTCVQVWHCLYGQQNQGVQRQPRRHADCCKGWPTQEYGIIGLCTMYALAVSCMSEAQLSGSSCTSHRVLCTFTLHTWMVRECSNWRLFGSLPWDHSHGNLALLRAKTRLKEGCELGKEV